MTDDSFPLQQDMEARSAQGGAVYFLRAAPGASFYFANSVRVPSNITLLWASPILLAKEATFYVRGELRRSGPPMALRLLADAPQRRYGPDLRHCVRGRRAGVGLFGSIQSDPASPAAATVAPRRRASKSCG